MAGHPLLFLSHSGADTEEARELKRRLESSASAQAAGLKIWFDKDDLRPGQLWQRDLESVITGDSTAFAVYVGTKGVVNWVESEVRLALSRANKGAYAFIPILSKEAKESALPPFAAQYQAVRNPLNDNAELVKLLEAALGRHGGPIPSITDEPFVGLRPMTETDAHRFFGREAELDELIEKLRQSRLVAVVADSGSGKSSLVQAGLVPKFRGGAFRDPTGLEPDNRIWHVVVMRPGAGPIEGLKTAVTTAAERLALAPAEKAQLRDLIDSPNPKQLAYALQCNLPAEATETLLVVDQFEELFTQTPEPQRKPFIDWLLNLIGEDATLGFRIVLTIRNDYFNLCSAHPELFDRLKQDASILRLKAVTAEGLASLVNEPLKLAGYADVDDQEALIRLIRRDVSNRAGDLALVQMALFETWAKRGGQKGKLVEAYSAVGGVVGALAHAGEEVRTKKLTEAEQEKLEAVLVRLVTLGDTGGATRRTASVDEFDPARRNLLE
jgi:TIR domain